MTYVERSTLAGNDLHTLLLLKSDLMMVFRLENNSLYIQVLWRFKRSCKETCKNPQRKQASTVPFSGHVDHQNQT